MSLKNLVGAIFSGIIESTMGGFKFPDGSIKTTADGLNFLLVEQDFLAQNTLTQQPFIGTAFGSGSIATLPSTSLVPSHPGIVLIRSSTTANSGVRIVTSGDAIVLQANEEFNFVFNSAFVTATGVTVGGFTDGVGAAAPTDGAFIQITAGASNTASAVGKTYNNGSSSTTGTSASLSANVWYQGKISVDATASTVTFAIYLMDKTLVWSATLSTNIPKTAGRAVGAGLLAWDTGTTAVDIVNVDYLNLKMPLQRGVA